MKLKQRLLNSIVSVLVIHPQQKNKTDILAAEKCEDIVEDIAIQFAIWKSNQYLNSKEVDGAWLYCYAMKIDNDVWYTNKQLFEIFKTEKNL